MKIREPKIGRNSIKESFDNLTTGMAYFNKNGLPILVNHAMDRLAFEIMGHDLQYEVELRNAIIKLPKQIHFSNNGKVWEFSFQEQPGYGMEYVAADITEIYKNNLLLQEKNKQLQQMNEAVEKIGKNYIAIAREEEILSMKMRIHSEMGKCGLNLQKYYQKNCPKDKKQELILEMQNAISMLKGEVGKTDEEDSMKELLQTADAIGAKIKIFGKMPADLTQKNLLVLAMRECLMNTIRHAGGDTVFVQIEKKKTFFIIEITNNGQIPKIPITEGGGLSSLRKKMERVGGEMSITIVPRFCLKLKIPVERRDKYR